MNEAKVISILLAEDNLVNQEVLDLQLSALGYIATIADNGRVALELWKQQSFDIVLTDCHMPEMDGFELTRSIRDLETNTGTHVPIIAVTANAMSEELETCIDSGMDDCLTKPVEMESLGRMIEKWLSVSTSQSASQADEAAQDPIIESHISEHHIIESSSDAVGEPVDPQVLVGLTGGDTEICKQLLFKFRDTSILIVDELISASEEARFDDIAAQAHKLKSSAKTVGAERLAEMCLDMEQAGKGRVAEKLGAMASDLKLEFDRVKQYINRMTK